MLEFICLAGNKTKEVPAGQMLFTAPGLWYWEVPEGVTRVMVACQGGGAWPAVFYSSSYSEGGQAGYTRYVNNIPVTPGEILTVQVAETRPGFWSHGTNTTRFNSANGKGYPSYVKRGTVSLVYTPGGREGTASAVGSGGNPASMESTSGGSNGSGFSSSRNKYGGWVGGFSGSGGSLGTGSVGGKGVNPITGVITNSSSNKDGMNYGGGGAVTFSNTSFMDIGAGAGGFVRILWDGTSKKKRSIPSNMPDV